MREMTGDRGLPTYIGAERVQNRVVPGLAIAIVLTLVTAMVGAVAVRGASGGSSSPDEAVRQLIDAGVHADVLGVLDVLDPAERDLLVQPVQDTVAELKRLQVLSGDIDLHHITGINASVDGLALVSHEVGDGVTDVTITGGRLKSSVDPTGLPLGTALRSFVTTLQGAATEGVGKVTSASADLGGQDISLATVRRDGSWYVSIGYSIAEAARRQSGRPAPSFGHGVPANGGSSPSAAVTELVRAATSYNLERAIELTPPGEMAALHDYAPLFLPEAEKAIADGTASAPSVKVTDLQLAEDTSGHRSMVTVKSFHADVVAGGEHGTVDFDGKCLKVTGFADAPAIPCRPSSGTGALVPSPPTSLRLATVEEGGSWYVSPVRTVLDNLLAMLHGLDPNALKGPAGPAGMFGGLLPMFGGLVPGRATSMSSSGCGVAPLLPPQAMADMQRSIERTPALTPAQKTAALNAAQANVDQMRAAANSCN
jgi:hypothetical protein